MAGDCLYSLSCHATEGNNRAIDGKFQVTIHHPEPLRVQGGHLPGRVQGWNPWDFACNPLPLARFTHEADAPFASA